MTTSIDVVRSAEDTRRHTIHHTVIQLEPHRRDMGEFLRRPLGYIIAVVIPLQTLFLYQPMGNTNQAHRGYVSECGASLESSLGDVQLFIAGQ